MRIISKYINRMVIQSFLLILIVFCSLFFIVGMVREASSIGQNEYHIFQAASYVILQMPTKVGDMIPLICLLAGVVSLGIFATNNELTIFRVSGISVYRICFILLKSAVFISIFAMLIKEYVAPGAYRLSEENKLFQKSGGRVVRSKSGIWTKDGEDFIFIGNVSGNTLKNVVKYSFRDRVLTRIDFAKRVLVDDNFWRAKKIRVTKIFSDQITHSQMSESIWKIQSPLKYILLDTSEPANLTMRELAGYVFIYKNVNKSSDRYIWVFWDRLVTPLKTIVMLILAVPMILGPLRSSNLGLRIIIGSLVGITFYFFSMFLGPLSILLQVNPLMEVLSPILVFASIGLLLLRYYR
ncbi:MAG: LPS export ABC transporter permease LptG [Legionellales bacterium]|nr:LPS export ABC transporter permease LptG [Legionellales bacterium]